MGVIGIPSVAMACADWPANGQRQHQDTATAVAAEDRWAGDKWNDTGRHHRGDGPRHGEPTAAPSDTPATAAPKTRVPRHGGAEPSYRTKKAAPRTTAPEPATTAPESTPAAPRPTTAAPKPVTAGPEPAVGASSPASPGAPEASGAVAEVVEIVNAERGKAGCSPVKVNTALTEAAQKHSEDMAASRTMSHTGSDGSSPDDRIARAGYSWSTYGENVAYGYSTPEQVMAGWMASPGHRENILNCAFEEIGVGLAQPGSYWTQDFGTAR
ncbi:Uncharacterized conserved protein YkwD, contains CAP (CSP/antigen 5/PR1) domain [Streptomyces prasinopilosus]|uniref:Uncharacterized conserved protein YkwD, contains CAP (CSP/antigen 5/PR1) domain n=3 Tax=Streptomyces prasinopilosus TaxID=67344 RepID=A0A1G6YDI6_9ACTN|nr:Uncharacterized conserved protein YkwD, contains CAP (CSP/antigen 5/PR1) domain [Streptomyces prasinopilosus]